jgi:hypothetical protein
MIRRLSLFLFLILLITRTLHAQEEQEWTLEDQEWTLELPGFGYLTYKVFWTGGWRNNPYAPTITSMDSSSILRFQSGDTLESPLTIDTVGTDPLDALAALDLELLNEPKMITLGQPDESTIEALIVEAKLDKEFNRLLVLALPPHQENWYLFTIDISNTLWEGNLPAAYSAVKDFHYVPNAPLLRVVFGYDLPEGAVLRRHELTALELVTLRLHMLDLEVPFAAHLLPDQTLEVGFYGAVNDIEGLANWVSQAGFFELVDFSGVEAPEDYQDKTILTTARLEWDAANRPQGAPLMDDSEEPQLHPVTNEPFAAIITNEVTRSSSVGMPPSATEWRLEIVIPYELEKSIAALKETHTGKPLAVVLDGRVLETSPLGKDIILTVETYGTKYKYMWVTFELFKGDSKDESKRISALINSGPLPVPMVVETIELLE